MAGISIPHFDMPFRFHTLVEHTLNMVKNGGFETDIAHWTSGTSLPLARSSAAPLFGSQAADLVCSASTAQEFHTDPNDAVVTPGLTYTFSAYINRIAGVRQAYVGIQWYTAGIVFISEVDGPNTLPPSHAYQRYVVTAVAPPTAARALLIITFANGVQNPGDEFYVDGVQFEANDHATQYVDTNGAQATRQGFATAQVVQQDTGEDVTNCVEAAVRTTKGSRMYVPQFGITDPVFGVQPLKTEQLEQEVESSEPRATTTLHSLPDVIDNLITNITVEVSNE